MGIRLLAVLLVLVRIPALSAQIALRSDRAARAMPSRYSEPMCDFRGNHWKVTAATVNLRNALEARDTAHQIQELDKGRETLIEAIVKDRQAKNALAWFTLARIYLYQGDVRGADSAMTRAQSLAPKCAGTVQVLRYQSWLPVITAATEFANAKASDSADSAIALYREAAAIDPANPQAALSAGIIFANRDQADSAAAYFQTASDIAEHAAMPDLRNQATFNMALMLERLGRHDEAAAALERYRTWKPDDLDAKRALSMAYHASGQGEKARDLDQELLKAGVSVDSNTSGDGAASSGATAADAMRIATSLYEEQKWAEAADAFQQAVTAAPYSWDAYFGLAASYLALKDGPGLASAAQALVVMEPLSVDALKLLRDGYRLSGRVDEAVQTAQRLFGVVAGVTVEKFTATSDSASFRGSATGRAAQGVDGTAIPPATTELMFEFLRADGTVVTSTLVPIPALKPEESIPLSASVEGKGIVAWRYRPQ